MGIFDRFFKMAQSEAHSVLDRIEDPIKMTEQGIRDLKKDLQGAMTSLAEVKATAIRLKKDGEDSRRMAEDYERKAMLLLQKMQNGEIVQHEAEGLAAEALSRKEDVMKRAQILLSDYQNQQKMADQLQAKVDKLRHTIQRYENDLITLKARSKTASSMKKLNQHMSKIDSSSTISMLEKMKAKVEADESLAQAYGELAAEPTSIDSKIDMALAGASLSKGSDSLAELKKKMGIQ